MTRREVPLDAAAILRALADHRVDYVVIGPTEKETLGADLAAYRARYPVVIESESYAIFDVRAPRPR